MQNENENYMMDDHEQSMQQASIAGGGRENIFDVSQSAVENPGDLSRMDGSGRTMSDDGALGSVSNRFQPVIKSLSHVTEEIDRRVKDKPFAYVLGALGVGVAVGSIFS
jgi:hypothetical protein